MGRGGRSGPAACCSCDPAIAGIHSRAPGGMGLGGGANEARRSQLHVFSCSTGEVAGHGLRRKSPAAHRNTPGLGLGGQASQLNSGGGEWRRPACTALLGGIFPSILPLISLCFCRSCPEQLNCRTEPTLRLLNAWPCYDARRGSGQSSRVGPSEPTISRPHQLPSDAAKPSTACRSQLQRVM